MDVSLIAAVANNGVIGRDNQLPWRIRDDMLFFKSKTLEALISGVFTRAVLKMAASFEQRAHRLYAKRASGQEPAKQV